MTTDNSMYMPVAPAYMNNGDMFGGNSAWWIIILLAIFWGGNGWNGNGNGSVNADLQHGMNGMRNSYQGDHFPYHPSEYPDMRNNW